MLMEMMPDSSSVFRRLSRTELKQACCFQVALFRFVIIFKVMSACNANRNRKWTRDSNMVPASLNKVEFCAEGNKMCFMNPS